MKYLNAILENDNIQELTETNKDLIELSKDILLNHNITLEMLLYLNLDNFIVENNIELTYSNIRNFILNENIGFFKDISNILSSKLTIEGKNDILSSYLEERTAGRRQLAAGAISPATAAIADSMRGAKHAYSVRNPYATSGFGGFSQNAGLIHPAPKYNFTNTPMVSTGFNPGLTSQLPADVSRKPIATPYNSPVTAPAPAKPAPAPAPQYYPGAAPLMPRYLARPRSAVRAVQPQLGFMRRNAGVIGGGAVGLAGIGALAYPNMIHPATAPAATPTGVVDFNQPPTNTGPLVQQAPTYSSMGLMPRPRPPTPDSVVTQNIPKRLDKIWKTDRLGNVLGTRQTPLDYYNRIAGNVGKERATNAAIRASGIL